MLPSDHAQVPVPSSLVIGVLTFHRPGPLATLLPILVTQARDLLGADLGVRDARVVVVDNDPAGSAASIVAEHETVTHVVEERRGISHARNRVLDEAADSDLLVFIDDDETPQPDWLVHLVRVQRATAATGVAGKVVSVAEGPLDSFVAAGGFLDRAHRERVATATPITRAASNNLLLDLRFVRESGLRFDPRFGLTGGEDSLFTSSLVRRGGRLVWCAEAVVHDHVPLARMTPDYMLSRARAMSSSEVFVELALCETPPRRLRCRLRLAAREVLRAAQGVALVGRGGVSGSLEDRARGRRALARSRGALSALGGRRIHHYGTSAPADVPLTRASETTP